MSINPAIIGAMIVGAICVVAIIVLDVARPRLIQSMLRAGATPPEANAVGEKSTPILAGVAVLCVAIILFNANHVDRTISAAYVAGTQSCNDAKFAVPVEAISGEDIPLQITNVSRDCQNTAAQAGVWMNGTDTKASFSLQPGANTYEAWISSATPGPKSLRLFLPDRRAAVTDLTIGIDPKGNPFPELHNSVLPISAKTIALATPGIISLIDCPLNVFYPEAVPVNTTVQLSIRIPPTAPPSRGSAAIPDQRAPLTQPIGKPTSKPKSIAPARKPINAPVPTLPQQCGDLSDIKLTDDAGKLIPPIGTFYDAAGPYVMWLPTITAPMRFWIQLPGSGPGGGAERSITVKTQQSFSSLATNVKDLLALFTTLLAALVAGIGYLRGNPPPNTSL